MTRALRLALAIAAGAAGSVLLLWDATLQQAVEAFRAALQEWTRERVPLDWAATQNNLGTALQSLGERESGTQTLQQAVEAYREALKEWTQEAAPYWHNVAQQNLDRANALLAQRRGN
jgi:tetratricopeptide (TPR) repeat protein